MRLVRLHLPALIVAGLLFARAAATEQGAGELRPIKASVTSPGAAVRSGPGESYYLTDTLPEETVVEVYRRQPDGWCAIRPPADSFSWVFAQNVRVIDDGLAEISKDDVAARVGSRLSSQRDVVQVRLHQGEKVAILGSDERDGKPRDGQQRDDNQRDRGLWYKIAPPAGEFRWVQASDIGLAGAKHEAAKSEEFDESESHERHVTTVALEEPVGALSGGIAPPPLAPVETVPASAAPAPAAPVPTPLSGGAWSAAKSTPPAPDITPIGPITATSGNLAQQLSELELRLSRMVAESPTTWNITPLDQSAELLLSRADTVADREAVKATLAKIDRFAAIQRRYASTNSAAIIGASAGIGAVSAGAAADPTKSSASPYDAVGILRPVVSRRPGAPQFALVNPQGQVVAFVTPSPDMNLQPFVGQRIGVNGNRGYIPEFRRAHVTAGRVTPLNERILR